MFVRAIRTKSASSEGILDKVIAPAKRARDSTRGSHSCFRNGLK